MGEGLLSVGTRVEFCQDGLSGDGFIMKVKPDDRYCYDIMVEWCTDMRGGLLHDCNGTFADDVGWMVEQCGITKVLGDTYAEGFEVKDSDLYKILGM